ncbi:MAG: xanthine dehydrogenase family protein molybdopterin-binding subunit, partial [Chloroflexota bacterium]
MTGRGRAEDWHRVLGQARYVDDLALAGALHCAFIRSQRAHAHVRLDGRAMVGGQGVYTARNLPELGCVPVILGHDEVPKVLASTSSLIQRWTPQPVLANGLARYVGEPLAVAVAASAARAADLVADYPIEYDDLPVLMDPFAAQADDAPAIHPQAARNRTIEVTMRAGDTARAFARADVVFEETFRFGRQAPLPMEPRGAAAEWDPSTGRLTMWSSTQIPHALRGAVSDALGIPKRDIHVITPEVGGGFGTKALVYPEELVVAALALRLGRPVKWIETRSEHFLSAIHARDQVHHIRVAATLDGMLLALEDDFVVDTGAYDLFGKSVPYNTAAHVLGPYRVPNIDIRGTQVVTNKVPCAPYRGSGRPEASFARERALHELARKLGMDPVALRRRNLIATDEMPYDTGLLYRDGAPIVYDNSDYHGCLDDALRLATERHLPPPAQGVIRASGVACFVQSGGKGPWETALIEVGEDG